MNSIKPGAWRAGLGYGAVVIVAVLLALLTQNPDTDPVVLSETEDGWLAEGFKYQTATRAQEAFLSSGAPWAEDKKTQAPSAKNTSEWRVRAIIGQQGDRRAVIELLNADAVSQRVSDRYVTLRQGESLPSAGVIVGIHENYIEYQEDGELRLATLHQQNKK